MCISYCSVAATDSFSSCSVGAEVPNTSSSADGRLNSIFSFLFTAYHLLLFQQPEPADVVMIQHSNKVVF